LLTESIVLAGMGGALGIGVASAAREAVLRLISADGSRVPLAVTTDARMLLFVAATASATAVLFGLAPAWQAARAQVGSSLGPRREIGSRSRQRLGSALVVGQVALSLVLLTGAGLFLRTIANLRQTDLGLAADRLLVVDVNMNAAATRVDRAIGVARPLLERIAALPGVTSVSLSQHGVLTGTTNGTNLMRPEGFPEGPDGFPQIRWDVVGPRYFSTIGTRLLTGRDFTDRDSENSPPVIAINAALARLFFRDANPIGRRLLWGVGDTTRTLGIVAVVPDVKQGGAREEPRPQVYLPYLQLPAISPNWILPSTRVLVRTATNPAALASDVRQLILSENARMSVMSVDIGIDLVSRTLVRERMLATLLVTFAALAVGLACLGLYGLIAYQVAQRTSEIGVRMALGAASRDVVWEMARAAFIWIIAGIAIGVPLAVAASRAAQTLLFGLSPTDAGTLVGAVGVMLVLGLVAGYLPARRVARIDPAVALRSE
jgi:predicted permease